MPRRLIVLAALAFVVYGGWAAWANHAQGAGAAWRALGVQGLSSATKTILLGGVIERLRRPFGATVSAQIAASLIATLAAGVFHVCLHLLAGTPEIVRTVVPSIAAGFLFVSYALWISRARSTSALPHGTR